MEKPKDGARFLAYAEYENTDDDGDWVFTLVIPGANERTGTIYIPQDVRNDPEFGLIPLEEYERQTTPQTSDEIERFLSS